MQKNLQFQTSFFFYFLKKCYVLNFKVFKCTYVNEKNSNKRETIISKFYNSISVIFQKMWLYGFDIQIHKLNKNLARNVMMLVKELSAQSVNDYESSFNNIGSTIKWNLNLSLSVTLLLHNICIISQRVNGKLNIYFVKRR